MTLASGFTVLARLPAVLVALACCVAIFARLNPRAKDLALPVFRAVGIQD